MTEAIAAQRENERQLITRAVGGDQDALRTVVEGNWKRVYSLCLRMTRNATDAEDLAQDAFVHVLSKLNTFRGRCALSTWIYRIATNTTLMHFRKKERHNVSLDTGSQDDANSLGHTLAHPDRRLKGALNRIALFRAIDGLPPGCRTILLLHDVEGFAHYEIARFLGCASGTSKSQLHKARRRMREALAPKCTWSQKWARAARHQEAPEAAG